MMMFFLEPFLLCFLFADLLSQTAANIVLNSMVHPERTFELTYPIPGTMREYHYDCNI